MGEEEEDEMPAHEEDEDPEEEDDSEDDVGLSTLHSSFACFPPLAFLRALHHSIFETSTSRSSYTNH
jgi:hypothetical protein